MMPSAIIIVPCYDEAQRLQIHKINDYVCAGHAQRFLFVNDSTTDSPLKVLQTLRDDDPKCYAICDLPMNVGKAKALRKGYCSPLMPTPTNRLLGRWSGGTATGDSALLRALGCQAPTSKWCSVPECVC